MPHVIEKSTGVKKKVVVVGGGSGGLEAVRVCAECGREVVLFEATGDVGGQLLLAARAGWRKDLIGIVDWFKLQLKRLGVEIRWNTFADEDLVKSENPDVVVIATGGLPDTGFAEGGGALVIDDATREAG